MVDYFSSLMQQTGISVESDIEPKGRTLHPSSSKFSGGGDNIAPIEATETKPVDSGSEEAAEDHTDHPRKETAPPPRILAPESSKRPVSNETATTPQTLPSIFQASRGSLENVQMTERPEPEQSRFVPQESPQKDLSRTDVPSERISPMEVTVEREVAVAKADWPPRRSPAFEPPFPDKHARIHTQAPLDQGMSHERIQQNVLKEIRRWVASQPVLATEELRSQVTTKVADEVTQALQKLPEKVQPPVRGTTEKKSAGEQDTSVHDLRLSIGPFNITVQQPVQDTRRPKSQPRRETKTAPDRGTSKLRRHYIRI